MANSNDANAFANNFIRGFSFVDEIKARNRAEKRLEESLAQQKEDRAFQKRRTLEADQQVRDDRSFTSKERDRAAKERGLREEGDRLASLGEDASDEELMATSAFSPAAAAEMARRNGEKRFGKALKGVQDIPNAGGGAGVTGQQGAEQPGAQSLSDAVTQEGAQAPADPATQAPAGPEGFNFAPSKGPGSRTEVPEEEFNKFSEAYQNKSSLGKVGDVVAGQAAQTVRAAGGAAAGFALAPAKAIRQAFTGEKLPTGNVGNDFTGTYSVNDDEWTSPAEFADLTALGDNAGIAAAEAKNREVTNRMEQAGERPSNFTLSSVTLGTRQGNALSNADTERRNAQVIEQATVAKYRRFSEPGEQSRLQDQIVQGKVRGVTVEYLNDRETLRNADPELAAITDRRMVPVLEATEAQLRNEISGLDVNSVEGRKQQKILSNLHTSRDTIARGQPGILKQSGVRSEGLKVGHQPTVQATVDSIFDPERPVVTQHTAGALNAAATVAGRITPSKQRLNETQVQSLATLAEAGWIGKDTALSVMMTGAWPPGQDPNAVTSIQEAGGTVWALTKGGNYFVLQASKDKAGGGVANQEIGDEQFKWIDAGIKSGSPNISDANMAQLRGIVIEDPSFIRSRFNVTSQEDMRRVGLLLSQSFILQGKKYADLDGVFWSNTKNAPTTAQIFFSPEMRDSLANELDVEYLSMPAIKESQLSGVDFEQVRQQVRNGDFGPTAAERESQYSNEEIANVVGRYVTMEREARANQGQ